MKMKSIAKEMGWVNNQALAEQVETLLCETYKMNPEYAASLVLAVAKTIELNERARARAAV